MIEEINCRRSIRKFKAEPVSDEMILQLVEAGRMAPSAKNRQPWKYIVYKNEPKNELLDAMRKGIEREETKQVLLPGSAFGLMDAKNTLRIMQEASAVMMVENPDGASPFAPLNVDERFKEICDNLSIGASIENILLEGVSLGLGTLWIANTCFAYPELMEFCKFSGQLIGAIAVGYPAENPAQRPRKPIQDIIEFRQ